MHIINHKLYTNCVARSYIFAYIHVCMHVAQKAQKQSHVSRQQYLPLPAEPHASTHHKIGTTLLY
jgi:hypothetical protein